MQTARAVRSGRTVVFGLVVAAALGALVGAAISAPASAHTALESSTPADGDTVDSPVSEITLVFTEAVTVVGTGFEVLDPHGQVIVPTPVTDDRASFLLSFDPPLAGGDVGVRFSVEADDGHVLEDSFSFTVTAAAPTTTTPPTAPAAPSTTAPPAASAAASPTTASPATAPPATAAPVADASPADSSQVLEVASGQSGSDDDGGSGTVLIVVFGLAVAALAGGALALVRARAPRS